MVSRADLENIKAVLVAGPLLQRGSALRKGRISLAQVVRPLVPERFDSTQGLDLSGTRGSRCTSLATRG